MSLPSSSPAQAASPTPLRAVIASPPPGTASATPNDKVAAANERDERGADVPIGPLAALSTTLAFLASWALFGWFETILSGYNDVPRLQCSLAWFGGGLAWAALRAGVAGALLHRKLVRGAEQARRAQLRAEQATRRLVESRAEEYVRWKSSTFVDELPTQTTATTSSLSSEAVTPTGELPDDWRDLDFGRLAERAFDVEKGHVKPLSDHEKVYFIKRAMDLSVRRAAGFLSESAIGGANPTAARSADPSIAARNRTMAEIVETEWRESRKAVDDAASLRARLLRDKNCKTATKVAVVAVAVFTVVFAGVLFTSVAIDASESCTETSVAMIGLLLADLAGTGKDFADEWVADE